MHSTYAQVLPRWSTLIVLVFGVLRLELRVSFHDKHKVSYMLTSPHHTLVSSVTGMGVSPSVLSHVCEPWLKGLAPCRALNGIPDRISKRLTVRKVVAGFITGYD